MAGETIKSAAICLGIRPWSRTSHVVTWLTPYGRLATVVKGAVRPKSLFLGQYDLNYTCEIVYYAHAHGDAHILRECVPVELREGLRGDYRALALAEYARTLVGRLAPVGPDCAAWFDRLVLLLDGLARCGARLEALLAFELDVLRFSGLAPDFSGYDRAAEWSSFSIETGSFCTIGRQLRVARAVAESLSRGFADENNFTVLLDAARVIGVFYAFHLDCASDVRRSVLGMMKKN